MLEEVEYCQRLLDEEPYKEGRRHARLQQNLLKAIEESAIKQQELVRRKQEKLDVIEKVKQSDPTIIFLLIKDKIVFTNFLDIITD